MILSRRRLSVFVLVNFVSDELLVRAGMALAAGFRQIGRIDGRVRIAVTGGYCAHRDSWRNWRRCSNQPSKPSVIARHVDWRPGCRQFQIRWKATPSWHEAQVFLRWRRRRTSSRPWRLDGVNAVAIGAYRRLPIAARNGLPVDTVFVMLGNVGVALGAVRNIELEYRGLGIAPPRMSCAP